MKFNVYRPHYNGRDRMYLVGWDIIWGPVYSPCDKSRALVFQDHAAATEAAKTDPTIADYVAKLSGRRSDWASYYGPNCCPA
jgi:hypothetical protein